ncbi:hypothetical protein NDU88_006670 [Pleurodeles waltl]|uniref:Uncharacterized protein n=1 Tax=Pleurodeles waltl TaxID=8319 RepID=A0AAV7QP84_PLEWA|nr:hypothetical protein NDU88_006670 [Pleurodeles waltl]
MGTLLDTSAMDFRQQEGEKLTDSQKTGNATEQTERNGDQNPGEEDEGRLFKGDEKASTSSWAIPTPDSLLRIVHGPQAYCDANGKPTHCQVLCNGV